VVLPELLVVALPVVRPEESLYVVFDCAEATPIEDNTRIEAAKRLKVVFTIVSSEGFMRILIKRCHFNKFFGRLVV
jgi:ribosome maturation factor RimP